MSELFNRIRGFTGRWKAARVRADRIMIAIAEDQLLAWALHPASRRRSLAVRGWADMLRSYA